MINYVIKIHDILNYCVFNRDVN